MYRSSLSLDGRGVRVRVNKMKIISFYFPLPLIPSRLGRKNITFLRN
jgi:hypothetical protein